MGRNRSLSEGTISIEKMVIIGGLSGFILIYPAVMILAHVMILPLLQDTTTFIAIVKYEIKASYSLDGIPWGLAFGFLGSVYGLTRAKIRVQKEKEVRQAYEYTKQMEHEVKKRTRELNVANEELKNLDELKDNIIMNVTHELRTPLTAAIGIVTIAAREDDPLERKELLNIAKSELKRQNAIIGNLEEMARAKSKSHKLEVEKINLLDTVLLAKSEKNDAALKKNISLAVDMSSIEVIGDFFELENLIKILLDNSIKFTKEGGWIKIKGIEKDDIIELCVSDSGCGISEDLLEKIFDPLFQVDSSKSRHFSGTGMGLANAREIVRSHGGDIWAKSKRGIGSKFFITLPKGGHAI